MKFISFRRSKPKKKQPKSKLREWRDSIIFAVVVATLFRWSLAEAFVIPTPSMENSLLAGDYLFVSKIHYGSRTPRTPLQLPLMHQKVWGTDIPSYLSWIQLPYYRLPGLRDVERGESVVFNIPPQSLNEGIDRPVDQKTYYVKRCVAIPGDRLEIVDKKVIVNGIPLEDPGEMKFSYVVTAKDEIHKRHLNTLGIDSDDYWYLGRTSRSDAVYRFLFTLEQAQKMKSLPFVLSVDEEDSTVGSVDIYPSMMADKWNNDFYGPITVPKKGEKIYINDSMLNFYGEVIKKYEGNTDVVVRADRLYVDGQHVKEYTFRQDYYFMMGDNRHNSLDSRYWGFVPEDHILGKPLFIWFSFDSEANLLHKVRWRRLFTWIE